MISDFQFDTISQSLGSVTIEKTLHINDLLVKAEEKTI
jgi:hypothetical protein